MPGPGETAGGRTSDKLDQSGFLGEVTHDELRDINAEIDALNPSDRIKVISTLSDSELETWSREMDSQVWLGMVGLNDSKNDDLFDDLAEGLDVPQLHRVYNALGDENRALLSQSIADKSGDQIKTGFVAGLAPMTTEGGARVDADLFSVTSDRYNQHACNAAVILGAMHGQSLEEGFQALDNRPLEAVLTAATKPTMTTYPSSGSEMPSYFFETELFARLADNVADCDSAESKGRFFHIGANQIAEIRDTDTPLMPSLMADQAAGQVAGGLTGILASDVNGIVTALASNHAAPFSRNGRGMSLYMAEMIRQGNVQEIHDVFGKVQHGDNPRVDPFDFLAQHTVDPDGNRNYQNLSNLGYMVGSIRVGAGDLNSDLQEKADLLNNIFALGFGTADKSVPSALNVATGWGAVMVNKTVLAVTDQVRRGHLDFGKAIKELAMPGDRTDSDFEGPFDEAIERVLFFIT